LLPPFVVTLPSHCAVAFVALHSPACVSISALFHLHSLQISVRFWPSSLTNSPSLRLDIIGRVAFGHDFKATATTASSLSPTLETPCDTALIRASWALLVNAGLTHSAFLGPLVMRAFPVVTRVPVPVPVVKAAGVLRKVVWRLGGKIVERERGESGQEGGKEKGGEGGVGNRTDILSILMRARREGKGREGLSDEQILDNVCHEVFVSSFPRY
jgi:hypothetical protein